MSTITSQHHPAYAAQRKGFAETVEFLSNGAVKAEEVQAEALDLVSVKTEYSSETGLTPGMRVTYGHANEAASTPQEQSEMSAIRSEIATKVREAVGQENPDALTFGGHGSSMAGGVQSFDLLNGSQRVAVYLDDTPGVPGGLLFIDEAVDSRPKPPNPFTA